MSTLPRMDTPRPLGTPRLARSMRLALGLKVRLLPMTDAQVETRIQTPDGVLPFQEYFVHRRAEPTVVEVIYGGMPEAELGPGVVEAIRAARAGCSARRCSWS